DYEIKSENLMQNHWNNECSKTKMQDGSTQVIQNIMPIKSMKLKSFMPSLINEPHSLTPPLLPPKPFVLIGGLSRYSCKHSINALKIKNLWSNQSNMLTISSRTSLDHIANAYFNSV
ncbi:16520_t:CDS:1, partial [Dentiscutata heterogama]